MISTFQGLRFFAFLFVFANHALVFRLPWLLSYGRAAVSFFFMLSGFLIAINDLSQKEKRSVGIPQYMMAKIRKFYPLMMVTIVLSLRIVLDVMGFVRGDKEIGADWIWSLTRNLLCIQSWWPGDALAFNGVCWFLSTILFLYLASRVLCPLLRKLSTRRVLLVGLSCFIFQISFACFFLADPAWDAFCYLFPPSRLPEFVGAMALGYIVAKDRDAVRKLLLPSTVMECVVILGWLALPHVSLLKSVQAHVLLNGLMLLVFVNGGGRVSALLSMPLPVWLGKISMPLFLIHTALLDWMYYLLLDRGGLKYSPAVACMIFASAFALSIALAAAWTYRSRFRELPSVMNWCYRKMW